MSEQIDTPQDDQSDKLPVVLSDNNENCGTQPFQATRDALSAVVKATIDEAEDTTRLSDITVQFGAETRFGCSTGEYHHDIPLVVLPPTPLKHNHGLSGIKDEFTGMSTPLSVVTEYRPRQ